MATNEASGAASIACDPPEDCRGHFDSCEHVEGFIACDACIAERTKNGPRYCWLPEQGESDV